MLKFHIIIIKFSIFTNKNSQSGTFYPKLKNTTVKIDIKSFSVYVHGKKNIVADDRIFLSRIDLRLIILRINI